MAGVSVLIGIHVFVPCRPAQSHLCMSVFGGKPEPGKTFPRGDKWFDSLTSALSAVTLTHWILTLTSTLSGYAAISYREECVLKLKHFFKTVTYYCNFVCG